MRKYNIYPKVLSICCLLLSIFGLWCALGSHLGIIKGDEQNFYLEIIGVCLFIPFFGSSFIHSLKLLLLMNIFQEKIFFSVKEKCIFQI